jgi:hypothetical protein
MTGTRKNRAEHALTVRAAAIFLACLAVSIGASFKVPDSAMLDFSALTTSAAVASGLCFFCAAMAIFWMPRLGYCLGFSGGLIVAISIARSESAMAPATTWMYLTAGLNVGEATTFLILRVLATGLAATAMCCSAIRMLPARVCIRGKALRHLTWPAVGVGLALSIM